jgi:hypothetical protein
LVGSSSTSRFERGRIRGPAAGASVRRPTACRRAPRPAGIEQEVLEIALNVLAHPAHVDPVAAVGEHVAHALFGREQAALLVDDRAGQRLGQRDRALSGSSSPVSSLSSVVLPAPLAPTMPMRSPRWMRREKSLMIVRSPKLLPTFRRRSPTWSCCRRLASRQLGGAPAAPASRRAGAHFLQLGEPALVALAPRGDAAFQPVRLDLQLRVEPVGGARFLGIDLLGPTPRSRRSRFPCGACCPGRATMSARVRRVRKVRSWLITTKAPV